jgi:hypothetical protein
MLRNGRRLGRWAITACQDGGLLVVRLSHRGTFEGDTPHRFQCQELEVSGRLSSGFGSFAIRGMCERDLR